MTPCGVRNFSSLAEEFFLTQPTFFLLSKEREIGAFDSLIAFDKGESIISLFIRGLSVAESHMRSSVHQICENKETEYLC